MSRAAGPGGPSGDQVFDDAEVREAEALLSGTGAGAEGGISVPWPVLFRHRIHRRVAGSDRYQWWVLWTVLAGLLSVNITFTVFVVALPQVARQLHTTVSTLTWTSTGPLLAFGVAAPILGKLGDLRGYKRLYLWGLSGAAVSVVLTASAPTAGVLIAAALLRRGPGGGHRRGVDGPRPPGLLPRGPGQGARVVVPGRGGRSGSRGDPRGPDHPVLRVADPVLGRTAPDGDRRGARRRRAAVARPARRARPSGRRHRRASLAPAGLARIGDPLRLGHLRPARTQPGTLLGLHLRGRRVLCGSRPAAVARGSSSRNGGPPGRSSRSTTSDGATSSFRSGPGHWSTSPTWAGSSSSRS